MGFEEVQDLDADTTISLGGFNKKTKKDNPSKVEGYYLGAKVTPNKKTGGTSLLHILKTPKGNLGVWGKTDMDRKLSQVTPGVMIQIEHTGMQETPKGEMYKFTVRHDSSNTIPVNFQVANKPVAASASYADDSNDFNSDDSGGFEADEDVQYASYEAEETAQKSALSALERKQKVEALLKGKGKRA